MPKYASLCSGIGGLDRAVEEVFAMTPAWFCEYDPAARTVLERHWPGVPIYADVKATDWTQVEPVELLCAGYPCQPFSHAGKRGGADDPRHLWPFILSAVRVLRPRLVVLENVAGHLSLGFDRVLADLAEAGFDAEWGVFRASDVGACHQRARLFVVATDARRQRHGRGQDNRGVDGVDGVDAGEAWERERARPLLGDRSQDAPDAGRDGLDRGEEQHVEPAAGVNASRGGHADGRRVEDAPAGPRGSGTTPADAAHVGRERGGAAR